MSGGSELLLEIRENDRSGTYRVVYVVETADCVFVLHAFQKKSKNGITTPKQEISFIKQRLKDVQTLHQRLVKEKAVARFP